jgi:squalene-hopene/tetraprenyl-beta-curcumene cyclase
MLQQPRFKRLDPEAELCPVAPELPCSLPLRDAVERAANALLAEQKPDGHWVYELEADCTIPAEYILMMHFIGEVDTTLQARIANYLRRHQAAHGGWPLYHGGALDLSCSVKAYYALKLAGDAPEAPHMQRAREAILAEGGAAHANVFTRITLALFEQVPWRGVPFIPVEVMLLPKWFPFHIDKVSYWSRTVMVPLFVLCTLKPRAKNPSGIGIEELFTTPPMEERRYFHPTSQLQRLFFALDQMGRLLHPLVPGLLRKRAINRAVSWFTERLNGEDGLGGIFPAMVNAYEALTILGYPKDHPQVDICRRAIDKLLVVDEASDIAYCQPCLSPVWDTGIACQALQEVGGTEAEAGVQRALDWLVQRQLHHEPGDWRRDRPRLEGGGWAFQYNNPHYPDLDDTSMVAWVMQVADQGRYREEIRRAANWVVGMRSRGGGFASFEVDNTFYYLNHIPFADHGALLDPPTADVTARCIAVLAITDREQHETVIQEAIDYLFSDQEEDGSWFGRWGTNYIYGTWSVLSALDVVGFDMQDARVRRSVDWLFAQQNPDGGWGESNDSYFPGRCRETHPSTPFQTAWALLGLLAAGEAPSLAVRRGVDYLLRNQQPDGLWSHPDFTAPGFPRVFYLKYHGYARYFPLWALARYRNVAGGAPALVRE